MNSHLDLAQKLHDRHTELREESLDNDEEVQPIDEDIDYIDKIISQVCPILDKVEQFEAGLTTQNQFKDLIMCEFKTRSSVANARSELNFLCENKLG